MNHPISEQRVLEWAQLELRRLLIMDESLYRLHNGPLEVRVEVERELRRMVLELNAGMLTEKLLAKTQYVPFSTVVDVPYVHETEVPLPDPWWRRRLRLPTRYMRHTSRGEVRVRVTGQVLVETRHMAAYPEHRLNLPPESFGKPVRISVLQDIPGAYPSYAEEVGAFEPKTPTVGHVSFP